MDASLYDLQDNYTWKEESWIHPSAFVAGSVKMGRGNIIGPNTVILGHTIMGNNNSFLNCTIGAPAEKHGFFYSKKGFVSIGSGNIFREYSTVHAGTMRSTQIKDGVIMLRGSHCGHDSIIEDGCIISCNAMIGGESYIMKKANLALGAILHQHSVIGSYSMVGMGSIVTKKSQILPGLIYKGNPVREHLKKNLVGLERNKVTEKMLLEERRRYNQIVSDLNG